MHAENYLYAGSPKAVMENRVPEGYEAKFAALIRSCGKAKSLGANYLIVAWPCVLGDTYEEIIESLSRIADAGLMLCITGRYDLNVEYDGKRLFSLGRKKSQSEVGF